MYSGASAVGIIIAIGNVGHHLHYRADEANVMLSRDSGLTWNEVAKGSHIYEVADHGGLIVLANNRIATNRMLYVALAFPHCIFVTLCAATPGTRAPIGPASSFGSITLKSRT